MSPSSSNSNIRIFWQSEIAMHQNLTAILSTVSGRFRKSSIFITTQTPLHEDKRTGRTSLHVFLIHISHLVSNKSIIYACYKGIVPRRHIHGVIPCSRARYNSVNNASFSFVENHHNFSTKLFHETHSYRYKYFLFIFFVHSYCDKMNKVDNTVGACDRGLISLYVYNIYTSKKTLNNNN